MNKAHPVPHTSVMNVPKVDGFVMDHLKQRFPRLRDFELGTIQSALLKCVGPLSCLWSELLDNNLLDEEEATINVHDVLEVVQRTLMLLGNANELVSQTRRCIILKCVDHNLEKYGKDPPTNNGDFLFGKEFCTQLKGKVESDKALTQVVNLSNCYQPYDKSCYTTLGHSKRQFFDKALLASWGPGRARPLPQTDTPRDHLPISS